MEVHPRYPMIPLFLALFSIMGLTFIVLPKYSEDPKLISIMFIGTYLIIIAVFLFSLCLFLIEYDFVKDTRNSLRKDLEDIKSLREEYNLSGRISN